MTKNNPNPIPKWVRRLLSHCKQRPLRVILITVAITLGFAAAAPWVVVDTDPENMLHADEPVRVAHRRLKKDFNQHDLIVVGIVNEQHPQGIFNPESLKKIDSLTRFAESLGESESPANVISHDILSLATVDDIKPLSGGRVQFDWLISRDSGGVDPAEVSRRARRNPVLVDTVVSADGKAAAIYIPISSKDVSYPIAKKLKAFIDTLSGPEQFHIAGMPVAEDTFGVEMFIQMAISAPAAMLLVFIMMLVFFRRPTVIVAPMIVAMLSVLITMGALIASGNPLHIMSSMIPIFIMPIAVLDSVHIVSELYDRYNPEEDRWTLVLDVLGELFSPMLFTSLTSAAGFASLALTPIPPVRVFGVFVAIGIMVAWLLTVLLIPAWFMLLSDDTLSRFGTRYSTSQQTERCDNFMDRCLAWVGQFSLRRAVPITLLAIGLLAVSMLGIRQIEINDNPVKWFAKDHPLRVADRVMNKHFGGTYMAYLGLEVPDSGTSLDARLDAISSKIDNPEVLREFTQKRQSLEVSAPAKTDRLAGLVAFADEREEQSAEAGSDSTADAWGDLGALLADVSGPEPIFKQPKVLQYLLDYQHAVLAAGLVGNATSLANIVSIVNRELRGGADEYLVLPATRGGVSQALLAYESSHRPLFLWHFVTRDFRKASLWLQLQRGDNKDMEALTAFTADYIQKNPPPVEIDLQWFGLTYLNVVWQTKMVGGMSKAIIGSVVIIFLLMTILLRSALWGIVSLIPFVVSIVVIYGVIGFAGKAYDMPVAVLSSLTLGLAVDFAIHFTVRARALYSIEQGWAKTAALVFAAPTRAITRNALVVAIGFTPLLLAPLTPYRTVGLLLASILLLSASSCLLLLPALLALLERALFVEHSSLTWASVAAIAIAVGVFTATALPALVGGAPWISGVGGFILGLLIVLPLRSRQRNGN